MLIWALGCVGGGPPAISDAPSDTQSDTAPTDTSETGDSASAAGLTVPERVALPYVSVGTAPSGTFTITANGASVGELVVRVPDGLTVMLETAPLSAGESRTGTITASSSTKGAWSATLTFELDGESYATEVVGMVGDPSIGATSWQADAWGECATVSLPAAPFPDGRASYTDSSVRICVPEGLADTGALGVITHLHGFSATISEVDTAQWLHAQAALSGRNAVFVLPQGPVEARDGDFGKLDTPSGLGDLTGDVLAVLYRDGLIERPFVAAHAISAHSGGYQGAANILRGTTAVAAVHLFDALYADEATFAAHAQTGVFRSNYTAGGGTDDENRALRAELVLDGLTVGESFSDDVLRQSLVTIGYSDASHDGAVASERGAARWLAASGLPRRPGAPPDLLSTLVSGEDAVVRWRGDAFEATVEGSEDGLSWSVLGSTADASLTVPAMPYLRVREGAGTPSDSYGAGVGDCLVVDGFDRVFGGSWSAPTHAFGARVAAPLGCSVASNDAVAEGGVDLERFARVIWLLGDESSADRLFDERERAALEAFVDAGGILVVSGAEVGFADDGWVEDALGASYVADDAGSDSVEGWQIGVSYPEDFPDVLSGDEVLWRYSNGQTAAVRANTVTVIGFALETLADDDLALALADL